MCGKPKVDDSLQRQMAEDAAKARADEEARKARITAGTQKIDQTFAGFNDGFFTGFRDRVIGMSQPELTDKFNNARSGLAYALARAGTSNSTIAGDKQADLQKTYDANRAGIISRADSQTTDLRQQMANEKSSLVSLLNATGDADRASNEALARSAVLFQKQPDYQPLGDIFAGAASGIGSYLSGADNRRAYNTYFKPQQGSGRIVGA